MALSRSGFASLAFLGGALVFGLVLGLVLAFGASEPDPWEERWAELGVPEVEFVFLGDFTRGEQEAMRRDLRVAQVVFAEHFRAVTSELTVYASTDLALLNEHVATIFGGGHQYDDTCFTSWKGATLTASLDDCPPSYDQEAVLAQAYFGILQDDAGLLRTADHPLTWLVAGSAVYAEALVSEARGGIPLDAQREGVRLMWTALGGPLPNGPSTANLLDYATYVFVVGFLATDWLIERAGSEAVMKFFRLGGHQAAFESAFGMSVDDVPTAFEANQRKLAPPLEWSVRGTVLGADGLPIEGVDVYAAVRIHGRAWPAGIGETDAQGSFEFPAPGSGYTITIWLECPGDNVVPDWVYAGEWGADGFVADADGFIETGEAAAEPFADGERDRTDLVIEMPETRESLVEKGCKSEP